MTQPKHKKPDKAPAKPLKADQPAKAEEPLEATESHGGSLTRRRRVQRQRGRR